MGMEGFGIWRPTKQRSLLTRLLAGALGVEADDCRRLRPLACRITRRPGLIDRTSGKVLARDREEWLPFDERSRKAAGIDPVVGQKAPKCA